MTDLSAMTDAELSAAVAVEVMGREVKHWPGGPAEWVHMDGDKSRCRYATDPAQATGLLESERMAGRDWQIVSFANERPGAYVACLARDQGMTVSRWPKADGSPHTDWATATAWPRALSEAVLAYHRSESDD